MYIPSACINSSTLRSINLQRYVQGLDRIELCLFRLQQGTLLNVFNMPRICLNGFNLASIGSIWIYWKSPERCWNEPRVNQAATRSVYVTPVRIDSNFTSGPFEIQKPHDYRVNTSLYNTLLTGWIHTHAFFFHTRRRPFAIKSWKPDSSDQVTRRHSYTVQRWCYLVLVQLSNWHLNGTTVGWLPGS